MKKEAPISHPEWPHHEVPWPDRFRQLNLRSLRNFTFRKPLTVKYNIKITIWYIKLYSLSIFSHCFNLLHFLLLTRQWVFWSSFKNINASLDVQKIGLPPINQFALWYSIAKNLLMMGYILPNIIFHANTLRYPYLVQPNKKWFLVISNWNYS